MEAGERDFQLLEEWRDGDRDAGSQLFDRHFDAIARFFRNKVDGPVEDLVQDTFLACVEGRDRFQQRSSFRTYLFAIARNVLYGHYRKRNKGDQIDGGVTSVAELGCGMGSMMVKGEEQKLLLRALRRLPLDFQITLELYYWEDLKGPQLAEALDISPHTVRSRLSRARAALKEMLEQIDAHPELVTSTIANLDDLTSTIKER